MPKTIRIIAVSLVVLQTYCAGLRPKPPGHSQVPLIRVLLGEQKEFYATLNGDYDSNDFARLQIKLPRNKPIKFRVANGKGRIEAVLENKNYVLSEKIQLAPRDSRQQFELSDSKYYGSLELSVLGSKLRAINIIDLETYLQGVVSAEIGPRAMAEFGAMKAQSVASRTYALRKHLVNKKEKPPRQFDVRADIYDQVYRGIQENASEAARAVDETRGEVLTYKNDLIQSYFHSTCGGRTEAGRYVFDLNQSPYLESVADNFGERDFCDASPHYRWVETFSTADVLSSLREVTGQRKGLQFFANRISDIKVSGRFPSGRVKSMTVMDRKGNGLNVGSDAIRSLFRRRQNSLLRSSLFRFGHSQNGQIKGGIVLIGAGSGHGVGMCQWGAIGMARDGYTYDQILRHYYRKTKLKKAY